MPDDLWSEPKPPFMLVLRAVMGVVFVYAGWSKLTGLDGATAMFGTWGVPLASVTAPLVGTVELLGGLGVLVGVFPRLSSVGLGVVMLGSMAYAKVPGPVLGAGWALDAMLFAAAATILVNGPGRWTVWTLLGRRELDPEERLVERATR